MESSTTQVGKIVETSKRFVQCLLTMGENRLKLLSVEVQEERKNLLRLIMLALGVSVFGLLAGITLTASLALLLWPYSPAAVLLLLTVLHGVAAVCLYLRLSGLLSGWQTFSASRDQFQKDRAGLEKILE